MNHLESTFTGRNNFWRYVVMIVSVFLVTNTIGAVPLIITLIAKSLSNPEILSDIASDPGKLNAISSGSYWGFISMMIPFVTGLIAFILLVKPLNNRSIRMTINGTEQIRWGRFFISAFIWLILSALYLFLYLKLDPSNFRLNNNSISLLIVTLISIIFIPFQATFEEVLFRGYLMQGFAALLRNRWFPVIMTSIFFGLMHSLNPEVKAFGFFKMIPQYIGFGLIFGIVAVMDDGIEATMGAHSANNIFLCIMLTSGSSALQTPALYEQFRINPWIDFVALVLTGIIFIFTLKIIFRWKSFSLLFEKIKPEIG